jgi:peptidoglycan/xylan/chitin deacetylase (PgdA/CDA1 family)
MLLRPAAAQDRARAPAAVVPDTITRVLTARPVVAMTFDDGPHPTLTPRLLDILGARGIRATFYVIGWRVLREPQLMRRIVAEGHEIGNHTWSHPSLFGYSDAGVLNELDRTSQAVYETVGRPPVTLRPPYGNLYPRQRRMVMEARNMPTVLWSVDPEDWRRPGSAAVASRIVSQSHPGGVILSHDIISGTVQAMPAALDGLQARGYQFLTVSELIGWPRWDSRHIRLASHI